MQNPTHPDERHERMFMPHWPQPGIQPRDAAPGDRIVNVAYAGSTAKLAPELAPPAWSDQLAAKGFCGSLRRAGSDDLGDYRHSDDVVAGPSHTGKPASKHASAWRAGMPAIVGPESAYLAAGQHGLGFLVARSPAEVVQHLRRLRQSPALHAALITNGAARAAAHDRAAVLARWEQPVLRDAPSRFAEWTALSSARRALFLHRRHARLRWRAPRARCGMPPP